METQYRLNGAVLPFSWNRVMMTGRFYWPDLKKQVMWYPVIAFVVSGLMFSIHGDNPLVISLIGNLNVILKAMFVFAPLVLGLRDQRTVAAMLPVSARERFTFLALYFLVLVPAGIFGIALLVKFACMYITPDASLFVLMDKAMQIVKVKQQMVSGLMWLPTAVTLWGVLSYRKSRTLKAALTTIALNVACVVSMIIYSVVYALNHLDMKNGQMAPDHSESTQYIVDHMMCISRVMGYVSVALTVVMLVIIYRQIRNYQD